jgi:phage gp29-like protein
MQSLKETKSQMPILIPQADYPELIDIINETYTDELDRILSAQIADDDSIVCTGQDGTKRIAVKITDTKIQFRLINDNAQFSQPEPDDPIDPILTQLKPIGDATFTEWFTTLQGLMQESDNLVEFRDKLVDAYSDLDSAQFKSAMLDASTIAGLQGYSDAKQG